MFIYAVPDWITVTNILFILTIGLIGSAVSVLLFLTKRQSETLLVEKTRADSQANLVKTRDQEIADLEKKVKEKDERIKVLETEVEDVTAEYRAIGGIILQQLVHWWQNREADMAETIRLRADIRVLKRAAGLGENDDIHRTDN